LENEIEYKWLPGTMVISQPDLVQECSDLFSNHYGIYSQLSPISPGNSIRLSPNRVKELFEKKNSFLFYARKENKLIGYAIAAYGRIKYGKIAWVTQLVVHEDFRNIGVGRRLLFSIWNMSNYYAWGLLTSSPYAIRALEKATRRKCIPSRIKRNKNILMNFGRNNVKYIKDDTEFDITSDISMVNTEFFTDRSCIPQMISNITSGSNPWLLGDVKEGWEWAAFTFRDQELFRITSDEIEGMLKASDQITKTAYSRMLLDENHTWARHASKEVDFIIEKCNLKEGMSVLDVGCGNGRHSIELAKRGFNVVGVDYSDTLVNKAKIKSTSIGLDIEFVLDDCRYLKFDKKFDVILCLYDVIGSYVDDADNNKIINNIKLNLNEGGYAIISVMNFDLTESKAIKYFDMQNDPDKLLELPTSDIMEKTGDIFDPEFYAIEKNTKIIYRIERFDKCGLPGEYIVRDRRFKIGEIVKMCRDIGLTVIDSSYVSAGKWDLSLTATHEKAKEILLICKL